MNDGVLIILPDVIIYEDVLHVLVKGVDPEGLPPTDGEGVAGPPEEEEESGLEGGATRRSWAGATLWPPFKVVLESPQTLDGAQVLVQVSLSIPAGDALLRPRQHHPPPAAADLPDGHVHLQLSASRDQLPLNRLQTRPDPSEPGRAKQQAAGRKRRQTFPLFLKRCQAQEGKLTHAEVTKVREERMSPFVQSSEKSPEQAREVAAEGAENDGELPSFLHQVSEQLEEGGQDPVVEPSVLSCHSQLSVPLQGTQSRHQLMAHVPRQRLPHTHTHGLGPKHRSPYSRTQSWPPPATLAWTPLGQSSRSRCCSRMARKHRPAAEVKPITRPKWE